MKKLLFILLASLLAIAMGCSEDNKSEEELEEEEEVKPVNQEPVEQDFDICHLGDKKPCFTLKDKSKRNVGICKDGFYNCIADQNGDLMWDESRCIDEVKPDYDYPCTPKDPSRDFDCNGIPDNQQDEDGDGYTICSNSGKKLDCCDNTHMCIDGLGG